MPTITLPASSNPYPVGTVVGAYAPGSDVTAPAAPVGAAIATGTVDAANALSITNAGIVAGKDYVLYAAAGPNPYVRARSTLDKADTGRAAGTGTLTTGSPAVDALTATSGRFEVGQRIRTITALASIPPGTFIERLASSTTGKAVTASTADLFTSAGHGYVNGDPVKFSALTGGTGIVAGTVYYVIQATTDTFKVSATPGGATLDVTVALTAGIVSGVALLSAPAGTTGAANLEADGAKVWSAVVKRRRLAIGTAA